ncbi:hypothetical protein RD792_010597 [Penstemon davidsonii]|uniref:NAC domain-containing protein n=1 Tax=Penstemon davidsonii TaxID=160366 RepID=A0ABR0D3H1_9LAMI|nr:hypothetical protein RD792_010597 [Penstemon davidsonii]
MHHQQVRNHGNANSPAEIIYVKDFPPGYRFQPTDYELIVDYLKKKVENEPIPYSKIHEVDIYKYNPKELSEIFSHFGERKWYFFTPRKNGSHPSRAASNGYWKATVGDKAIHHNDKIIGSKKSLVFYEGKPPKAKKTNWLMQEYRVHEPNPKRNSTSDARLNEWVMCRIYNRDGQKDKDGNHDLQPNENSPSIEENLSTVACDYKENLATMACDYNGMGQSNGLMKRLGIDHTHTFPPVFPCLAICNEENHATMACDNIGITQSNEGLMGRSSIDLTSTFPNTFANSNQSGWENSILPPIHTMENGSQKMDLLEDWDFWQDGFHAIGVYGDNKNVESTESIDAAQVEPSSNVNSYIDFNDPIFDDITLDVDNLLATS